jgi:hypothetical protein
VYDVQQRDFDTYIAAETDVCASWTSELSFDDKSLVVKAEASAFDARSKTNDLQSSLMLMLLA